GAAVDGDGTVWLASSTRGLTSWRPGTSLSTMTHWRATPGLPTGGFVDVAADVDGAVWLVVEDGALLRFDPRSATVVRSPITDARRLYVDRGATPRALYVARRGGVSVLR